MSQIIANNDLSGIVHNVDDNDDCIVIELSFFPTYSQDELVKSSRYSIIILNLNSKEKNFLK